MAVLTDDTRFYEILNEPGKGEIRNMCEILDRVEARGEARGEAWGEIQGILRSIQSLMKTMKCSAEQAMDLLEIPVSDRKKYLCQINIR